MVALSSLNGLPLRCNSQNLRGISVIRIGIHRHEIVASATRCACTPFADSPGPGIRFGPAFRATFERGRPILRLEIHLIDLRKDVMLCSVKRLTAPDCSSK